MSRTIPPVDLVTHAAHGARFEWCLRDDRARVTAADGQEIWSGSLLPSWELVDAGGNRLYVDAVVAEFDGAARTPDGAAIRVPLVLGDHGLGSLELVLEEWGVRFTSIEVRWARPMRIVEMYLGSRRMTDYERSLAPRLDAPHWPTWSAQEYAVPCAESNPTHSFWRSWDLGDAVLPLGHYGDALGTPYAAAFPRPLFAAAMGGKHGWIALGVGEVPDGALTMKLRSATSCFAWLYREDLWGAPDEETRTWHEPFRLSWADTAYAAYARLYASSSPADEKPAHHSRSFVCTWGDFKVGRFDLRAIANRAAATTMAEVLVLDDLWESSCGSGVLHTDRFPTFDDDLRHIRELGFQLGFWQPLAWVDRPEEFGLDESDLLCGIDGKPRRWVWSGNPRSSREPHFLLDPSSDRARQFLVERTRRLVQTYDPVLLKLDFGYGIPGPDVCAPRDPELRGERLAGELIRIIGAAARAVKPAITIAYYGIHPLLHDLYDMVNLDDLGDAGASAEYERLGHSQRCMWAALAASHGMAINTSTGYFWGALAGILLDTAVVGANGLTLGESDADGRSLTDADAMRWRAISAWRRRACSWAPVWLDVDMGGSGSEPLLRSWARVEQIGGERRITAAALRGDETTPTTFAELGPISFTGAWALISQDDEGIATTATLACIPFLPGVLIVDRPVTSVVVHGPDGESREESPESCRLDDGSFAISTLGGEIDRVEGYLLRFSPSVRSGIGTATVLP